MTENNELENKGFNFKLIPIMLILGVLPFLVYRHPLPEPVFAKYSWFNDYIGGLDIFLYAKMILFSAVTVYMIIDVFTSLVIFKKKEKIEFLKKIWLMAIYLLLVIISTIASLDMSNSLKGAYDQMEPVMVLVGYAVTVPYVVLSIKSEKDIRFIYYAVFFSTLVTTLVGFLQFRGYNIFEEEWMKKLITEDKFYMYLEGMHVNDGVHSTFGNTNYVGSYVCIVLPIVVSALFTKSGKVTKIIAAIEIPALVLLLIASRSKTGLAILALEVGVFVLFRLRFILKRWYIFVPLFVLMVAAFIKYDSARDFYYINTFKRTLYPEKATYDLTGIVTTGDCIKLTYKGSEIEIRRVFHQRQKLEAFENGEQIEVTKNGSNSDGTIVLKSGEALNYSISTDEESNDIINIKAAHSLYFKYIRETEDYKIKNGYGGWDESIIRPNVLAGYERLASGRGYIWGITIPLLKDYILKGAGPDTFPVAVGLNGEDYAQQINAGYYGCIFMRPHNYYLQMAVVTGCLSLLSVLVFVAMFIITCFRKLFWRKLENNSQKFAFFCMLAVVGFLGCGIANDSMVSVTPLFWTALGLGYAMNSKGFGAAEKEE